MKIKHVTLHVVLFRLYCRNFVRFATAVVDRDLPVPQFSYSSSDEDDDYFDAADEIPCPMIQNHVMLQV